MLQLQWDKYQITERNKDGSVYRTKLIDTVWFDLTDDPSMANRDPDIQWIPTSNPLRRKPS